MRDDPPYLAGMLIPWPFSTDLAADHDVGTDYTEADEVVGAVSTDATTRPRMQLAVSGTPDVSVLTGRVLQAKTWRGGMPGPGGAGILARETTSATWLGADDGRLMTGWQAVEESDGTLDLSEAIAVVHDGTPYAFIRAEVTTALYGTQWHIRQYERSAAGAWSFVRSVASSEYELRGAPFTAPDGSLCCLVAESWDGDSWHLQCYRLVGTSWLRQGIGYRLPASGAPERLVACALSGSVVALLSLAAGTCAHLLSRDGGTSYDLIGTSGSGVVAVDIREAGGVLHVLSSSTELYYRRIATVASSLWDVAATQVSAIAVADPGGALAVRPDGTLWIYALTSYGMLFATRSTDYGRTWALPRSTACGYRPAVGVGDPSLYRPTAIAVGQEVAVLALPWDGSALLSSPTLHEITFGGLADLTQVEEYASQTNAARYGQSFAPIGTLAEQGWVNTDVGTVTRVLDATGETITVGALSSASSLWSAAGLTATGSVRATLEVNAGTATILVRAGTSEVTIDLTSTGIRCYKTGATPPSYTTHSTAGQIEIVAVVCDGYTALGATTPGVCLVAWRAYSAGPARRYTVLSQIDDLQAALSAVDVRVEIQLAASTTATIRMIDAVDHRGMTVSPSAAGSPQVAPIPLSAALPSPILGGLSLRAVGGPAVADGSTWTIAVGSSHAKDNVLPTVAPSPRVGWQSSGQTSTDEILRFTPGNGANPIALDAGDVLAVYLDGLSGIIAPTIDLGGTPTAVDLSATIDAEVWPAGDDGIATLAATQTTGPWIERDELAGGVAYQINTPALARRIVGNSAGLLADPATSAVRAVVRIEGCNGDEATGEWKIVPPRALILCYAQEVGEISITIDSTDPLGPDGDRRIGVAAIGPVALFGRPPDRTAPLEVVPGAEVVDLADGRRTTYARQPTRRRTEVAWADDPHDLHQLRGGSEAGSTATAPDYAAATSGGSPSVDRYGAPLEILGIVAQVGRDPIVWLPSIPIGEAPGAIVAHPWQRARGAVYGRIVSSVRSQLVPVGAPQASEMVRVDSIAIEEEL